MEDLLRTPSEREPGVKVERLVTKNGEPAKVGERAYDKKTGRLAQVGLHQQIAMKPSRKLTSLQGDFLASHSVAPGSERARRITVTSGLRCLELYRKQGPLGSLARMCLASSTWASTKCFLRWRVVATKSRHLLFQLAVKTPRTEGTDFGLLPTPDTGWDAPNVHSNKVNGPKCMKEVMEIVMLGTPRGTQAIRSEKFREGRVPSPEEAIAMLPTPKGRDFRSAEGEAGVERDSPDLNVVVGTNPGSKLQPAFVEWMMGYPDKWTELTD
jgi:hypothetical protein